MTSTYSAASSLQQRPLCESLAEQIRLKVSDFSLWAKPQPEGATAVFLLSNQNATTQKPSTVRPLLLPIPRPVLYL